MIYCRGNEYENEEFKWGHCGISEGSPRGIIHDLSIKGKVQLATYYARQYLSNSSYINLSIFDTLFGYFSTYIQHHQYLYLWHYIPWNEEIINNTLINEYGWEKEKDTPSTWRIGDGSAPFYNYIYYSVQGFTENDTFRSNQIREGDITRKKALELVYEENRPRYASLKWYFDVLGLDGDMVLTVIDKIPKKY